MSVLFTAAAVGIGRKSREKREINHSVRTRFDAETFSHARSSVLQVPRISQRTASFGRQQWLRRIPSVVPFHSSGRSSTGAG